MAMPDLKTNPILEAVTWAAASGNTQEIKALLASHDIPKDVREFGAKVAAAGRYCDVVDLLAPRNPRYKTRYKRRGQVG